MRLKKQPTFINLFLITEPLCMRAAEEYDRHVGSQFCLSEYEGAVRVAATTNAWGRWWSQTPADLQIMSTCSPCRQWQPQHHRPPWRYCSRASASGRRGLSARKDIWSPSAIRTPCGQLTSATRQRPRSSAKSRCPASPPIFTRFLKTACSTIGYGGDENGLDGSIMVSLFDVSDFGNPLMIDNLTLLC